MLKHVESSAVGETGEGPGYVLYHDSFRNHLLESETVKNSVEAAGPIPN